MPYTDSEVPSLENLGRVCVSSEIHSELYTYSVARTHKQEGEECMHWYDAAEFINLDSAHDACQTAQLTNSGNMKLAKRIHVHIECSYAIS